MVVFVVMTYFCNIFVLHPIHYPRTTLALPPSSNSDQGSNRGPSSSLPTSARAFIFYRKNKSAFSSLVDSRRIVPTHAAGRSQQQLIPFSSFEILQIIVKSHILLVGIELKNKQPLGVFRGITPKPPGRPADH